MTVPFTLRPARPDDHDALGVVMFRAVREGDSPYTDAQRVAWMPKRNSGAAWSARLASQDVVLGAQNGAPVGFMTVDASGYIDLAYVLPDARGQGLFSSLLQAIERLAQDSGAKQLTTHASLMAQPAFARHGFAVFRHETVTRNGQSLRRAEMFKRI